MELFTAALRDVADAHGGMGYLSEATHLNRETLYRTLSKNGNPRLDILYKVLGAMGLRIGWSECSASPDLYLELIRKKEGL